MRLVSAIALTVTSWAIVGRRRVRITAGGCSTLGNGRSPMRSAPVLLMVLAVVAGCGGAQGSAGPLSASASAPVASVASPMATAAPTPTLGPMVFRSPRYPYSITLTREWTLTANPGHWTGVLATLEDPGTDLYYDASPPAARIMQLGFLPVAQGMTLSAWAAAEAPRATAGDCTPGAFESPTSLGGNVVILEAVGCPETFVTSAFLVHDREGVLLQWGSPRGNETADRATFLAILATLKFG